jgi:hypothetical protein
VIRSWECFRVGYGCASRQARISVSIMGDEGFTSADIRFVHENLVARAGFPKRTAPGRPELQEDAFQADYLSNKRAGGCAWTGMRPGAKA